MKVIAVCTFLAVLMIYNVEADVSFNLTGGFNPGFRKASHKKHKSHKDVEHDDSGSSVPGGSENEEWPSPNTIHNYGVPDLFTHHDAESEAFTPATFSGRHRGKSNHKTHKN